MSPRMQNLELNRKGYEIYAKLPSYYIFYNNKSVKSNRILYITNTIIIKPQKKLCFQIFSFNDMMPDLYCVNNFKQFF